jgi:hypothetical protein
MGIPSIRCDKCGYVYSLTYMEGRNDRGQMESYLTLDPSHICIGGFEMKVEPVGEEQCKKDS